MYLSFFELQAKPFELLPNPDFLFLSDIHKKALTFLEYGLLQNTGFILFTGEVGTGKTTIIRKLLKKISDDITVATLFNTQLDSSQLIKMINTDFGIKSVGNDKAELLYELNEFLIDQYAAGQRSVLIIDEAQNLGLEQLEEIRLLSNLETNHSKLLQIILVGQPELRDKLASQELIQLRQRILVHSHLAPLSVTQVSSYIYHRLEQAGNRDAIEWRENSIEIVHKATRGIPRLINILCDYILLDAYTKSQRFTNDENMNILLKHLDFEAQFWGASDAKIIDKSVADEEVKLLSSHEGKWSPQNIDKLCDNMQTCLNMMQQSLVSLSQIIVLLSQNIASTATEQRENNSLPDSQNSDLEKDSDKFLS